MASAQVLFNSATSSRKQGHLEAGKRRLEEFRKKKAEDRAKKAASTGQLQSYNVSQHEKFSKESNNLKYFDSDGASAERESISSTQPSGLVMISDGKKTNTSWSVELNSSIVTNADTSTASESKFYDEQVQKSSSYQESKWPNGSSFPWSDSGHYNQWRTDINGNLSSIGTERESMNGGGFVAIDTVHTFPNINGSFQQLSYSVHETHSAENTNSLREYPVKDPGTTNISLASNLLDKSGSVLQNNVAYTDASMNRTTSAYDDFISSVTKSTESAPRVDPHLDGNMDINNASVSNMERESLSHYQDPKVDSASWQTSESFSSSSFNVKSSFDRSPLNSTSSEVGIRRSRPSFLDSLNVPRVSSVSNLPFAEINNSENFMASSSSKVHNAEIYGSSASQTSVVEPDIIEPLAKSSTTNVPSADMYSLVPSVSVNNDEIPRLDFKDNNMQKQHEFPSVKKDDDFAALEQHIEDLTQEKFSLQRALEASRVLAESLAVENSSLTDSYNQQGAVINQLKSDMERLQEEIRDQLLAVESMKMEYANAQLECNAADERAKILAAEVIGLEEKALRLKSDKLKLERELENSTAEFSSYKRKVSSLQKEHQDLRSTIAALQEEKKLLQSKLREASKNGEAVSSNAHAAAIKNVSTSTDDLDPVDSTASVEDDVIFNRANNNNPAGVSAVLLSDMTSFPSLQESREFPIPDTLGSIPPDQLRMIDNINLLISELATEKEELVRALAIESSNSSKLKDLNKDLSQKLEAQTQRLELLTAQRLANENMPPARPADSNSMLDSTQYADEGDEVVERVLGWIMKLFPGGPTKRRTSKLL